MTTPAWAVWQGAPEEPYTVGLEEEIMLLDPADWALAQSADSVLADISPELHTHVTPETHGSALELRTGVHRTVRGAIEELAELRARLVEELEPMGLRAAAAGTHPFAVWQDTVVPSGSRQQAVYGSMRELARREPTFALHVHVGVPDAEDAIRLVNRLRAHVPLLLAMSANSPFWQGRDTGLASARTPLFQAFPRVGIPRAFRDYADYVDVVDLLIRCQAFPEATFLWWDVRPQPRFGTVEVRVMDAQTTMAQNTALVALVQSIVRLELSEGFVSPAELEVPEVLDENRFLAARDGMEADLIDRERECRRPARERLGLLLARCAPHARELDCATELSAARRLSEQPGSVRQLAIAREPGRLAGLVATMADAFAESATGRGAPAR